MAQNNKVMDVIVIGCGSSGIAALRRLHDAGLKVMGLEAAERIGGRICSQDFGEGVVDLGAAWCHGKKGGEKDNIVFQLANPLGLLGKGVARSGPVDQLCIQSNGEVVKEGEKIMSVLEKVIAEAEKDNDKSISETLRVAAKSNQELTKNPQLTNNFIEWYERNNHVGGQNDPRKGKPLRGLLESKKTEEFMLHWKGGYKTILDILLNKYPDPSKAIPVDILLHKEVESINWSSSGALAPLVHVKCKDGSLYEAKRVIITLPVGVLKETHAKLFNPPLPAEKVTAINTFQMCVLDKIYVEFEKPWWNNDIRFNIVWREEDKKKFSEEDQWITEIYGLQTVDDQKNVLLTWIYGNGAEAMEKISEEGVKEGVKKLLELVFKDFGVTPIKNIIRTKWASNRFARGSYFYPSVATEQDGGGAVALGEPLRHADTPVVCFAGEATSHHPHGCVHGSIEAGFREADRLIESLRSQ